jgi:amino acid transporter
VALEPDPRTRDAARVEADDVQQLRRFGYAQELRRRMGAFSNFAVSFSIICILAGGITSFHLGLCGAGGAGVGLGWPLAAALSLCVALSMAQIASAFPIAGGLYHWAAILGGRGWGWLTAWFNLAGLVTVLAAIDVGAWQFTARLVASSLGDEPARLLLASPAAQAAGVTALLFSQALLNHLGIRLTSLLTDLAGWLIVGVAAALTGALLAYAPALDLARLSRFENLSGAAGGGVWPATGSVGLLFLVGLLLPAYTITGFDASAHTSEETLNAAAAVPRGIVRSVLWSGLLGWAMVSAIVLAAPSLERAAAQGDGAFAWIAAEVLPPRLRLALLAGTAAAQYLCGLATVTSASRMSYAFARDGGVPLSRWARRVSPRFGTPVVSIWAVSAMALGFTIYTPVYSTITSVCTMFLYVSYVVPIALGLAAHGRTWTRMGPWSLGPWYRPVAVVSVAWCALLLVIGVQPPNGEALWLGLGALAATALVWFGWERRRFAGPPSAVQAARRA